MPEPLLPRLLQELLHRHRRPVDVSHSGVDTRRRIQVRTENAPIEAAIMSANSQVLTLPYTWGNQYCSSSSRSTTAIPRIVVRSRYQGSLVGHFFSSASLCYFLLLWSSMSVHDS